MKTNTLTGIALLAISSGFLAVLWLTFYYLGLIGALVLCVALVLVGFRKTIFKPVNLAILAWVLILAAVGGLCWFIGRLLWPYLPDFWRALKGTLTFCAFWLLIGVIIRALWWLGSMFKHKARS